MVFSSSYDLQVVASPGVAWRVGHDVPVRQARSAPRSRIWRVMSQLSIKDQCTMDALLCPPERGLEALESALRVAGCEIMYTGSGQVVVTVTDGEEERACMGLEEGWHEFCRGVALKVGPNGQWR